MPTLFAAGSAPSRPWFHIRTSAGRRRQDTVLLRPVAKHARLRPELTISVEDVEVGHAEHGGEVACEPCGDPGDRLRPRREGAECPR